MASTNSHNYAQFVYEIISVYNKSNCFFSDVAFFFLLRVNGAFYFLSIQTTIPNFIFLSLIIILWCFSCLIFKLWVEVGSQWKLRKLSQTGRLYKYQQFISTSTVKIVKKRLRWQNLNISILLYLCLHSVIKSSPTFSLLLS